MGDRLARENGNRGAGAEFLTSDDSLTDVPKAERDEGDLELRELFERFHGQLVSPGGAANLLGLSRKTIHTLGERGKLRIFNGPEQGRVLNRGRGGPISHWRTSPRTQSTWSPISERPLGEPQALTA